MARDTVGKMTLAAAVKFVNRHGALLVFPDQNKREPKSLWYEFFPNTKMRWEWDSSGDSRVGDLWFLREKLSTSRKVVYGKFFRDRATVMSLDLFTALLKILNPGFPEITGLSFQAREILDLLEEDSPLSTKSLKRATDLQGKESESLYQRSLKELWRRHLIVAFGEVDEGAFPSIAVGATRLIFEDVWNDALALDLDQAEAIFNDKLAPESPFAKFYSTQRLKLENQNRKSLER